MARLHGEGLIVAVKEFSGDPRRAYAIRELAPELDVLAGSDDTVLEVALAGEDGWISGFTSAFPRSCIELYRASMGGDLTASLCRFIARCTRYCDGTPGRSSSRRSSCPWILSGALADRCRPPRVPLTGEQEAEVRRLTEQAVGRRHELNSAPGVGDR